METISTHIRPSAGDHEGLQNNRGEQVAPWLDRSDALSKLDASARAGRISPKDVDHLRQWRQNGSILIEKACDPALLEELSSDIEAIWSADEPISDLAFEELRRTPSQRPGLAHCDLVTLSGPERERLRRSQSWRIHSLERHSTAAKQLLHVPQILRLVSLVLDAEPVLLNSITFEFGSEQHLHEDAAVTQLFPPNYLVGIWIACEDIHPDSGPLVFYPGSHRRPIFSGFPDYPLTSLRNCNDATTAAYRRHITEESRKFEPKLLLAERGDALLWHPMLIHGGTKVEDRRRTRRSFVYHYLRPGVDRASEIRGPSNW